MTVTTRKAPAIGRDCMFLSGWVIDCNIGVYAEEKGVTQKIKLSIDAYHAAEVRAERDEMETVPSYTDIIDAVGAITARGHIELLETFAEEIASICLKDMRLTGIRVRIEKLERGPVRGIEIYRERVEAS